MFVVLFIILFRRLIFLKYVNENYWMIFMSTLLYMVSNYAPRRSTRY